MDFKVYIDYKSYLSFIHLISFYVRIFQLHFDGTNALQFCKFSIFHIAEFKQGSQIGAMSAGIFDASKGCARAP